MTHYAQLYNILDYIDKTLFNLASELESSGNRILELYNFGDNPDVDQVKEKEIKFICNQLILLHAKGPNGYRYVVNVFLKRSIYSYGVDVHTNIFKIFSLFLHKSIYGHILESRVLPGSFNECKEVINRIFLKLDDNQKICFILADEIYVKPAIRFRGNHIVGMAVNQDQPCPAKTILTLMVNLIFGAPAFVARLLPVMNLTANFCLNNCRFLLISSMNLVV